MKLKIMFWYGVIFHPRFLITNKMVFNTQKHFYLLKRMDKWK